MSIFSPHLSYDSTSKCSFQGLVPVMKRYDACRVATIVLFLLKYMFHDGKYIYDFFWPSSFEPAAQINDQVSMRWGWTATSMFISTIWDEAFILTRALMRALAALRSEGSGVPMIYTVKEMHSLAVQYTHLYCQVIQGTPRFTSYWMSFECVGADGSLSRITYSIWYKCLLRLNAIAFWKQHSAGENTIKRNVYIWFVHL